MTRIEWILDGLVLPCGEMMCWKEDGTRITRIKRINWIKYKRDGTRMIRIKVIKKIFGWIAVEMFGNDDWVEDGTGITRIKRINTIDRK
jgi:hypothetical protein